MDGKGAAPTLPFGLGPDLTVVKLHQPLRKGQAETGTLVLFREDRVELCEGLKEFW